MGRFVDVNEGESECELCERVGFITVMWLGEFELLSCSLLGGKYLHVLCLTFSKNNQSGGSSPPDFDEFPLPSHQHLLPGPGFRGIR